MQIIIDIDENLYTRLFDNGEDIIMDMRRACVAIRKGTPLPKCKECKHFEYDSLAIVDGVPLIVAHEICKKWSDGCKTDENGYCFLFERGEEK